MNLSAYETIVFDCDGVVLDSNKVKTEAFRTAAKPYGQAAADALVAHHVQHGGISRYAKFDHFADEILPVHAPDLRLGIDGPDHAGLLDGYAAAVRTGLLECAIADGLARLRAATPNSTWMIVSGGDQNELRYVFAERGIAEFFDGGIFGSPDTKDTILAREQKLGRLASNAIFLGDSKYDYVAASRAELDFVFLSGWTEVRDWQSFTAENGITVVQRISDLI